MDLLGGDEVGRTPRHVRILVARQLPAAAVELGDAQGISAHVGEPPSGWIWPRVEDRAVDHELTCHTAEQTGDEQSAGQWKRHHGHRGIGGERRDARRGFAHALAAGLLFRGDVVGVVLDQQRDGIGDQSFLIGFDVEHVETVDGVIAGATADEDDALAVG
jgi:hypothetical protein